MVQAAIQHVTERIVARSDQYRKPFLAQVESMKMDGPMRGCQSCSGAAHAGAALSQEDQARFIGVEAKNIGIITAHNDMLSAHEPFGRFPEIIKNAASELGHLAQIAGGVPAMCDGVTQGQPGMHLSLFSRDIIAKSAAIGGTHNVFDMLMMLGTCDKIKPALFMFLGSFAHLPVIFAPGGPMREGQSHAAKNAVRQAVARGEAGREEELTSEFKSYHEPGTCTFYGTANSNEMLAELGGFHLPGSTFINPSDPRRDAMTIAATRTLLSGQVPTFSEIMTEKTIVNMIVGLHATGGSTNLVLHLPAIARMNGIHITLDDIADLSAVVPSISRVYPNGKAGINVFQEAGGMPVLIHNLLHGGYLHEDVKTVAAGQGLSAYTKIPDFSAMENNIVSWGAPATHESSNPAVISTTEDPFMPDGGIRVMRGILGEGISKASSLEDDFRVVSAPVRVFDTEMGLKEAYDRGELTEDFIAVVRGQGPHQTGMPELHKLIPVLKNCQDDGLTVGLVTNGRLSGASGAVPTVIHVAKEDENGMALQGDQEPINKVRDGDVMTIDTENNELILHVPTDEFNARTAAQIDSSDQHIGHGRDMFGMERRVVSSPQSGCLTIVEPYAPPALDEVA